MADKKDFKTANELRAFLAEKLSVPREIYVKEVYNLGSSQYCDSPLFIYSGYSVIMAYLTEDGLSLTSYDKDFFIQHIRGGIFREDPDAEDFYYFSFPNAKLINSFVQNFNVLEREDGSIYGIDISFENKLCLHLEPSSLVSGTMSSRIIG